MTQVVGTSRPTVAAFGLFGVTNIGNEASLESLLRFVENRCPGVDVVVVCAKPEAVAAQHGARAESISMAGRMSRFAGGPRIRRLVMRPALEIARWWTAYRFVRSIDAIVVPGTGILDDFGVRPHEMPYDLFRWSAAARLAGRRMSMLSVGAGPIDRPLSRWLMRHAVGLAGRVTYRDEASRAYMAGMGAAGSPAAVRPDVAFALARPPLVPSADSGHLRVGLGVMAYFGWTNDTVEGTELFDSYIDAMTSIAKQFIEAGNSVRLLVGESSDWIAVERLSANLNRAAPHLAAVSLIVEPIDDFDGLLRQVRHCDVVVATRFHNVVASLMMERPTVSIGYAAKNVELMSAFGLGAYCHHVEDIDPEAIVSDVLSVMQQGPMIAHRLSAVNERYVRDLAVQFEESMMQLDAGATSKPQHARHSRRDTT